jgi:hypothetical protein
MIMMISRFHPTAPAHYQKKSVTQTLSHKNTTTINYMQHIAVTNAIERQKDPTREIIACEAIDIGVY